MKPLGIPVILDARMTATGDKDSATLSARPTHFLGPNGENADLLKELVGRAIDGHVAFRKYHNSGGADIPAPVPSSPDPKDYLGQLDKLNALMAFSAPMASPLSHGHMHWDHALAGTVGYFLGMLYNQNNVAAEASPVTTWIEQQEAERLCRMLGFLVEETNDLSAKSEEGAWGHITCDGSVANIEAAWAARNARFLPLAVREAVRCNGELFEIGAEIEVTLKTSDLGKSHDEQRPDRQKKLLALDDWEILNVPLDEALALPRKLIDALPKTEAAAARTEKAEAVGLPNQHSHGKDYSAYKLRQLDQRAAERLVWNAIGARSIETLGLVAFYRAYLPNAGPPMLLVPATAHYSWPKATTVLGLGAPTLVRVDEDARMDIRSLRAALEDALRFRRPVIAVVAVIGSTAESSVDPLLEILDLRDEFREKGLDFWIHADAAWGGYFCTALPKAKTLVPEYEVGDYASAQLKALALCDSVTVDPHKAGYVPYPAGALCYRNIVARKLVTLSAQVVRHGENEPTVGVFGLEGSKPGAAAAAVYLTHETLGGGGDLKGYGGLLRECVWTSKRLYARLLMMFGRPGATNGKEVRHRIAMFRKTLSQASSAAPPDNGIDDEDHEFFQSLTTLRNDGLETQLKFDKVKRERFEAIGGDLNIINYAFNFWNEKLNGWNQDAKRCAHFNKRIFRKCSTKPNFDGNTTRPPPKIPVIITNASYDPTVVGQDFVDDFGERLGLRDIRDAKLQFLISTTMNPDLAADNDRGSTDLNKFVDDLKKVVGEVADEFVRGEENDDGDSLSD